MAGPAPAGAVWPVHALPPPYLQRTPSSLLSHDFSPGKENTIKKKPVKLGSIKFIAMAADNMAALSMEQCVVIMQA